MGRTMRDLNFSVALTCRQYLDGVLKLRCTTNEVGTRYFAKNYREHFEAGKTDKTSASAANVMVDDALIADDKVRWLVSM